MRFVTEPLTSCLQHLIDVNKSGVGSSALDGGELDEIVIQKGILQVAQGLDFLHTAVGMVHLDIQPSSILINVKGDWKLSGLGFVENMKEAAPEFFLAKFDPRLPSFIHINLDYSAPELILDHRLDTSNDIFSLGCLIVSMFILKPVMRCDNNANIYKQEFSGMTKVLRDERIPAYIREMIPQMVMREPSQRLTLEQFKCSSLFDNVLIRTINFLDEFPVKLPSEQLAFMKGFSEIIDQFPKPVLQKKILPTLLEELGKEETLVASILTNVFQVGKDMSQLGFAKKILPAIKKVTKVLGAQVTILNHMEILKSRLNGNEFRDDILPIVLDTMNTAPPEIQELALQKIPIIIDKLDFITLKNDVFPVVGAVFANTTSLSVKLESLQAFEHLVDHGLDKFAITEKLLPLLNGMKTREPKVMMGALSVYSKVITIVDIEVLAKVIVPQLLSMSMESMLNLGQFRAFIDEIKTLLDRIETEHGKRLSQVQVDPGSSVKRTTSKRADKQVTEPETFESLVNGTKKPSAPLRPSAPSGSGVSSSSAPSNSVSSKSTPNSSFGSLKLEPTKKTPFAPLQPSSASRPTSTPPASSTSQLNWQQLLTPKPSIGFGATSVLSPMNPSSFDNPRPSSAAGISNSFMSNKTLSPLSSSITPFSSSTGNLATTTVPSSIDWTIASKPQPPAPAANDFGDFQSTPASPPPLTSPTMGFSTPLTPSVPGWNGSSMPALQPQQKYHISRSSTPSNPTNSTSNSNNFSLI